MVSTLPPFNQDGLLPPGDYELSFNELRNSYLVTGKGIDDPDWDIEWRLLLVNNAEIVANQLWQTKITSIYLDGSFVEDKSHPNDIDGYFEVDTGYFVTGLLERKLNALDSNKIWTWDPASRKQYKNYAKTQLPMWIHYRVELFPHYDISPGSGIQDEFGNNLKFPAAFRKTRNGHKPKGIIKLKQEAQTL